MLTLPNCLTFFRIFLVPFFIASYYLPLSGSDSHDTWAAVIFLLAAMTDALDGYLARALNQSSRLGSFLDPIADKFLVISALCVLMSLHRLPLWMGVVIIGRELMVSSLREWMAILGQSRNIAVSMAGKLKTAFQFASIVLLLVGGVINKNIFLVGQYLMNFAVFLTLLSMIFYIRSAWPYLKP